VDSDKDEPQIFEVTMNFLVRVDDPELVFQNARELAKKTFAGKDLERELEEIAGELGVALVSIIEADEIEDIPGTTTGSSTLSVGPLTEERRNRWDFRFDVPK
jgi:hypothetical protein